MGNKKLEKLQRKSYEKDLKIAEYSFTCNQEEVICHESPKITVEGEGIRLHFFRYGLLDKATPVEDEIDVEVEKAVIAKEDTAEILLLNKATEDVIVYNKDTKEVKQTIALEEVVYKKEKFKEYGLPQLKNFSLTRTALCEGYIYLINDEDPEEYYELAVDKCGMLSHILWEYSKDKKTGEYLDIRKKQSEKISYKMVEKGKKLRVAFSPVQWSRKYFNEINASNEKKERMQLIECNGFSKEYQAEENAMLLPFHQVKATFPNRHPFASILQDNLNDIFITERAQDQKAKKNGEANETLEDMFITFHDPTTLADEICLGIDREIIRLQAIITSLQTGKSLKEVFKLLLQGKKVTIDDNKTTKQILYLFRLAQLSYDFVYNTHENTDKYGEKTINTTKDKVANVYTAGILGAFIEHGGASKKKLEKILGKKERLAQKSVINSYRDDLGNFMKSDYYQDALEYCFSGIADDIEDAKGLVAEHFIVLGQYPNMYDRHLDLNKEYQLVHDEWYKKINETLYNKNPEYFKKSTKILDISIDIQDINKLSLTKKTIKQIEKIFKAYANHETYVGAFTVLKQKEMPITGKVSYFRDKKTRKAIFKFKALENFETEINGKKLTYEINGKPATLKKYKQHWHLEYEKMTRKNADQLVKDGKLEVNLKGNLPKRFKSEVEKFLKSNAFAGVVLMIEAYVWGKAVKKITEDPKLKNFAEFGEASIKLGAATGTLIKEMKLYDKYLIKRGLGSDVVLGRVRNFTRNVGALKIISSAITVFTASRDSYLSFSLRDNDAATIYAMASGIGATFLFADISMLVSGSAAVFGLGFWPAALLGGALVGCYYLAAKYFKDSELEAYFKNYPLSDFAAIPSAHETSQEYISRLVVNPAKTMNNPWFGSVQSDEFKTYTNFEKAYTALLDILVPSIVIVEPASHEYIDYHKGFYKYNAITHRFKASIYSAQKINDLDQLAIKAWYYPYGINTKAALRPNGRIAITTFIYEAPQKNYFNNEELTPNCQISFGLPNDFIFNLEEYPKGEVLFICRIKVADGEYIPTSFHTEPRYIFGHAQTHNKINTNTNLMQSVFSAHRYGQRIGVTNVKLVNMPKEEALRKPKIISEKSISKLQSYYIN
ncbi:toxin VasX [Tenacibaculum maritimum]|uniref:toxin VasX n=1 Tax=Tenacibaculum maritimum TaxID=107401 RepID=UPI0010A4C346|nr:toxin VasX [Tenacibaculum maritimum]QCD62678.1 hypothetical protein B9C57_09150 [Tenacibaculum maritimum]